MRLWTVHWVCGSGRPVPDPDVLGAATTTVPPAGRSASRTTLPTSNAHTHPRWLCNQANVAPAPGGQGALAGVGSTRNGRRAAATPFTSADLAAARCVALLGAHSTA
jgi:hypothetical protein